jgi:hypothetical protein
VLLAGTMVAIPGGHGRTVALVPPSPRPTPDVPPIGGPRVTVPETYAGAASYSR